MSNDHSQHTQHEHPSGYEKTDTNLVTLTVTVVISVVVVALAVVFVYDYFIATKEAVIFEQQLAPVSQDLEKMRAEEERILTTYGVVDSTAGLYRIPIEKAMELTAKESGTSATK